MRSIEQIQFGVLLPSRLFVVVDQWTRVEEIRRLGRNNYRNKLGGAVSPYVEPAGGEQAEITVIDAVLPCEEPDLGVGFSDRVGLEAVVGDFEFALSRLARRSPTLRSGHSRRLGSRGAHDGGGRWVHPRYRFSSE